ncbi:restriction endonuclease subunit S [Photobacterium phosphoreum]|uniref:restriction endonuclease subunit S n=1 Tax=Photobacterium phosphoreum TaxID=659 RepID=UPI002E2626E9|nr:restriction endonuclease subunit S [Photobacterium phosphoreum]
MVPLKYLAELTPKKSELEESIMSNKCTFLPMEKLKLNSIILDETRTVKDVYDGYTYFRNGDVLIAKVTPCFENKNMAIAADLTNGIGFGSSEIYVLRPNHSINNRFLYYRLQEDNFMAVATGAMTGAGGLKRVPSETVNNFTIAIPTTNEQTQIAAFLDHETAKIDTLIEKQQQLIELLKEKRQAVISHAVTKGLNPQAPMKDSGVEWLGEVPEHWVQLKLKHVVKNIIDAEHKTAPYFDNSDYLVCRTTNVRNGKLLLDGGKYTNKDTFDQWTQRAIPEEGDILFTREAPAGEACVYDASIPLCLGQRMVLFKLNKNKMLPEFVLHSLYSGLADDFIKQLSQGSTVSHFNMADIQNIPLFEPPFKEQLFIIEYLKKIINKYDAMSDKAASAISLMQERRTAFISAAVTGKIDVRHWVAPTTSSDTTEVQQVVTA